MGEGGQGGHATLTAACAPPPPPHFGLVKVAVFGTLLNKTTDNDQTGSNYVQT